MTNESIIDALRAGEMEKREAFEKLYLQNRGLFLKVCRKYGAGLDLDDLMQECFFALDDATRLYKPEKGTVFSNTLYRSAMHTVLRYRENNGLIRIPVHAQEGKAGKKYQREADNAQNICSISAPVTDTDNLTVQDTLQDEADAIGEAIDSIYQRELQDVLKPLLDSLTERQQRILHERYWNGCTQRECGAVLGCSHENIRLIEQRVFKRLRREPMLRSFAYSAGLKGAGLNAFKRSGMSAPERAVILQDQRRR